MDVSQIKKVFNENEVELTKEDIWKVQQAWVIKHAALERLAAKLGISFDSPVMLQGPSISGWDGSSYAMLVRGRRTIGGTEYSEWSVGEVNSSNYRTSGKQPAYPWAMLEKRSKDRALIKLAGLHGAYSEDEADDFSDKDKKVYAKEDEPSEKPAEKPVARKPARDPGQAKPLPAVGEKTPFVYDQGDLEALSEEQRAVCYKIIAVEEIDQLTELMASPEVQDVLNAAKADDKYFLRSFGHKRLQSLGWLAAKAAVKAEARAAE